MAICEPVVVKRAEHVMGQPKYSSGGHRSFLAFIRDTILDEDEYLDDPEVQAELANLDHQYPVLRDGWSDVLEAMSCMCSKKYWKLQMIGIKLLNCADSTHFGRDIGELPVSDCLKCVKVPCRSRYLRVRAFATSVLYMLYKALNSQLKATDETLQEELAGLILELVNDDSERVGRAALEVLELIWSDGSLQWGRPVFYFLLLCSNGSAIETTSSVTESAHTVSKALEYAIELLKSRKDTRMRVRIWKGLNILCVPSQNDTPDQFDIDFGAIVELARESSMARSKEESVVSRSLMRDVCNSESAKRSVSEGLTNFDASLEGFSGYMRVLSFLQDDALDSLNCAMIARAMLDQGLCDGSSEYLSLFVRLLTRSRADAGFTGLLLEFAQYCMDSGDSSVLSSKEWESELKYGELFANLDWSVVGAHLEQEAIAKSRSKRAYELLLFLLELRVGLKTKIDGKCIVTVRNIIQSTIDSPECFDFIGGAAFQRILSADKDLVFLSYSLKCAHGHSNGGNGNRSVNLSLLLAVGRECASHIYNLLSTVLNRPGAPKRREKKKIDSITNYVGLLLGYVDDYSPDDLLKSIGDITLDLLRSWSVDRNSRAILNMMDMAAIVEKSVDLLERDARELRKIGLGLMETPLVATFLEEIADMDLKRDLLATLRIHSEDGDQDEATLVRNVKNSCKDPILTFLPGSRMQFLR